MSSAPEVVIAHSAAALAHSTAVQAVDLLADAVDLRGSAHLVVTGGSILERVLAAMAEPEGLAWDQVHIWWGDERFVPSDSPDRNDLPAMSALFDRVGTDLAKVHRMPAADAAADAAADIDQAAAGYARELASLAGDRATVPTFDLVLLGVGPDGHCASLFPGHPGTKVVDRSVIGVPDSPKPPPQRLSLTFPALNAARQVWIVASGEGKADAVGRALSGADPTDVPSAGARGTEATRWLIDEQAAAELDP